MPNHTPVPSSAARASGVLVTSADPPTAGLDMDAACSPVAVLCWAVHTRTSLTLCDDAAGAPSSAGAHVALLARRAGDVVYPRPVPNPVRTAFATDGRALAARLLATRATLVRRGMPPDELEGVHAARAITLCAWADGLRAEFDAADWAAWAHFAARPLARGVTPWLAGVAAVQGLIGTRSPRRGVRARHRAAVRAAAGV